MSRRRALAWAALLGGAALWRLLLFTGPQGSDDFVYSELAHALATGTWRPEPGIFQLRLGYLGPIAAIYGLFGASSFTLEALNLAASVAEVGLAWILARRFLDERGAWIAAGIVALVPVHVYHASEAHPDVPVAALTTFSAIVFLRARDRDGRGLHLAAGGILGAAHLMKESAFFGLAALAALGGRPRPRDAWTLAGFAGAVLLECAAYGAFLGDPLHRIRAVQAEQLGTMSSDWYLATTPTPRRLLVDVPAMLFAPWSTNFPFFALLPAAAAAGAVLVLIRKERALRPVAAAAAVLVGLVWFWPVSLVPYRPAMVAHPRLFLTAVVPMAVLAARLLRSARPPAAAALAALVGLSSVGGSWVIHSDARRLSAGARTAFERLPADGTPVLSDPRTVQFLRLYDGYRESRAWRDWSGSPPEGAHVRVANGTCLRFLRENYGIRPPAWFAEPPGTLIHQAVVAGRKGLRAALWGGGGGAPDDEVRVVRIP
jgi:hypothetical protein